jgi:hypothetical protein
MNEEINKGTGNIFFLEIMSIVYYIYGDCCLTHSIHIYMPMTCEYRYHVYVHV